MKEAKGCIAPVSVLTGEGTGDSSRVTAEKLKALVYPKLEAKEKVFLTIASSRPSPKGEGEKGMRK